MLQYRESDLDNKQAVQQFYFEQFPIRVHCLQRLLNYALLVRDFLHEQGICTMSEIVQNIVQYEYKILEGNQKEEKLGPY